MRQRDELAREQYEFAPIPVATPDRTSVLFGMVTVAEVDVEQELASLCGVLNASYARLVAIVGQALVDESWAGGGIRSPEHWLTIRAGLSPFRAKAIVDVARRSAELPAVMGQFADGQLSLDQVAVVARYAPAHVEASVAELAVNASVPQLRRALSRYSFDPPAQTSQDPQAGDTQSGDTEPGNTQAGDAEPGDTEAGDMETGDTGAGETGAGETGAWNGFALPEDRSTAPAQLSMSYDEHGRFTLRFSAPADLGALVEAALKEAKDALFRAGRPEVTFGDAMVEMAQRSLGAVESINRRDAYRTYVHLDTEGGWLTGRPRLPQQITEKLSCGGILQPVWHTQGAPVNVGRAQRIVPTRTRRLVEDRDRGCRFPGCAATAHLECHHLIPWADGGPTDTWNLASLCPFHHDGHHAGDFTITGNADDPAGLTFTTRGGFPIRPGPTFTTPTPTPDTGADPATTAYRGPTGETLNLRWVNFHESREPACLTSRMSHGPGPAIYSWTDQPRDINAVISGATAAGCTESSARPKGWPTP
jgi:Domain of unknown function (DUF222)/HNH endonuclease